mmetsp:Transcript_42741/g.65660  ORF Transcript_42741/g.65660 Transcript_42741/m.65660 type:complete len:99 (+) Transcript_42741:203-499(+)
MNTILSRIPRSSLSQIQSLDQTDGQASTVKKTVVSSHTFAPKAKRVIEFSDIELDLEKAYKHERNLIISRVIEEADHRGKLRTAVSNYLVLSTSNLLY